MFTSNAISVLFQNVATRMLFDLCCYLLIFAENVLIHEVPGPGLNVDTLLTTLELGFCQEDRHEWRLLTHGIRELFKVHGVIYLQTRLWRRVQKMKSQNEIQWKQVYKFGEQEKIFSSVFYFFLQYSYKCEIILVTFLMTICQPAFSVPCPLSL